MSGATAALLSGTATGGGSGGADVTLDALNWSSINSSFTGSNETLTISGINTTVTLTVTDSGGALYYSKNGGVVSIASGGTLTVLNGDTLSWVVYAPGVSVSGSVVVTNTSNGGAAVDTFSYDVTVPV